MKNKTNVNPFLRIFIFVAVLGFIVIVSAICLFYYIFGIPEPEGISLAYWPDRFTNNFSVWMENNNGNLKIEDIALERLDEYGLWIQVIDETGKEIFSHNKPAGFPISYSASELVKLGSSEYSNGNTVFTSCFEDSGKTWSYLVGFPYDIGKYMLYYNGKNAGRLFPVFRMGICLSAALVIIFVFVYGLWLTRHLGKITKGINNISLRSYSKLPEKGIFSGIYKELNKMYVEICSSDKVKKDTEKTRREWINNITHDLKTPLSPVKGYAELLAGSNIQDMATVHEYAGIILKNTCHVEKLVNDLKIVYQLESGVIPYNPCEIKFIRYIREIIIDIVNDPVFINRKIEFESSIEEIIICADTGLLRRAISNLIVNALTHNPLETEVKVIVNLTKSGKVSVIVSDNGRGMGIEEQEEAFNRYYRGTNTEEKPEGSGLGLAVAKQVITLHGGSISVKSNIGQGTEFTVLLPVKQ
ncbi:MAG: HAMP domain-containing histidine kinase [Lachnospiraceae bacterium]|jgi:Signal transduction histidine kinase